MSAILKSKNKQANKTKINKIKLESTIRDREKRKNIMLKPRSLIVRRTHGTLGGSQRRFKRMSNKQAREI